MKKTVITLLIASCSLTALGQFFSEEEKTEREKKELGEIRTTLPEEQQKAVYLELCEAVEKATQKAVQMYPVKIHQTPDQREAQQEKSEKTKQTLIKHYREDLIKKHRITEECLDMLEKAGKEKKWPTTTKKPDKN
jgi:hypothetical protein